MENTLDHFDDVYLDVEHLKNLQRIYSTDITVGSCINVLTHYLVPERRMRIARRGVELDIEPNMLDRLDSMAHEMFMQILCWGFVMFTTKPQLRCVSIGEIASIRLQIGSNKLIGTLHRGATSQDITIINAFGASPLSDGTFSSTIAKIERHVKFAKVITDRAISIETQKVHPDIYCESNIEEPLVQQTRRGIVYETRHTPSAADFTYASHREDAARKQQEFLDEMQDEARDAHDYPLPLGVPPPNANFHVVPEGLKMKQILTAEGRSDYVHLQRVVSQSICAVFGVPRSMLINDSVARADTSATHTCFRISLRRYRKHLTHALSVCCSILYGDTVTVDLPDAYHGGSEELLKLYLLGAIPFDQYAETLMEHFNIQKRIDEPFIDPLDAKQRADIAIQCMQSMVTQHHGRT